MFLLPLSIFGITAKAPNYSPVSFKIRNIAHRQIPHELRYTLSLLKTKNELSSMAVPGFATSKVGQSIGWYDNALRQKCLLKFPRILSL